MAAMDTKTKGSITLQGSAAMIKEFFHYGINNILFQRGIYPPDTFIREKKYGMTLLVSSDIRVQKFLEPFLKALEGYLRDKVLRRMIVAISDVKTKEVVERWVFNINNDDVNDENVARLDEKRVRNGMSDVLRQITASVAFLPQMENECSFDVLTDLKAGTEASNQMMDTKTKGSITLQGSAAMIKERFYYAINSVLHQRRIYDPTTFIREMKYGQSLYISVDIHVQMFFERALMALEAYLRDKVLRRMIVAISDVKTKEVVERWVFHINNDDVNDENVARFDEQAVSDGMADLTNQINSLVACLPDIMVDCSFDVLIGLKSGSEASIQAMDMKTKGSITLQGSAAMIKEFFHYGINNILFKRGIYPRDTFIREKKYGMTLLVSSDIRIQKYLEPFMKAFEGYLRDKVLRRMIVAISDVKTKEVVERWVFNINNDDVNDENVARLDEKRVRNGMSDVLRQITAYVAVLPPIFYEYSFDVLIGLKAGTEASIHDLEKTRDLKINNAETVPLRSFSTGHHDAHALQPVTCFVGVDAQKKFFLYYKATNIGCYYAYYPSESGVLCCASCQGFTCSEIKMEAGQFLATVHACTGRRKLQKPQWKINESAVKLAKVVPQSHFVSEEEDPQFSDFKIAAYKTFGHRSLHPGPREDPRSQNQQW